MQTMNVDRAAHKLAHRFARVSSENSCEYEQVANERKYEKSGRENEENELQRATLRAPPSDGNLRCL